MKRLPVLFLLGVLLAACQATTDMQSMEHTPVKSTVSPTTSPTITPTPIIVSAAENLVIQCGENLQLLGSLQKDFALTLFKANGLEYYSGGNFIEGRLVGNISISSEIKGTNLRLQNNTLTKTSVCFIGFQNGERYAGKILPVAQLLNGRKVSEQFEGSFLIQKNGAEFGLEWLTYKHTSSSKKNCILYRIIKNPYPCSQDCSALETKPGCECFCANFLYYDENCIPTEINPNCICACHGDGIELTPTLGK
ncbi:MAG: hypothetical protein GYA45_11285 [Pelolinea sp.]|jgi:hypothetical protein|nr:hypothetical protein [Pelolinea sp.]